MKKAIYFLTLILLSASLNVWSNSYPKSDHFDGKLFHNPGGDDLKSLWQVIEWKWNAEPVAWPPELFNKKFNVPTLTQNSKGTVTFINHSSFLIQLPGFNILTDPVFSNRVSPVRFAGPKRVRPPGISLDELPVIHAVLISHNHYDHLDLDTLKTIDAKFHPLFLVPLGDAKLLLSSGIQNVKEMDWWEEFKVRDNRIVFAPAQHWSSRTPWDKNKSLWGSYMINGPGLKVYFAGDTGYGDHFLQIKTRLGAPDVALIPIGAYKPRSFMKHHHMNPEEAVKAHVALGSDTSLAMHFGTFQISDEGIDEPVKDLVFAKKQYQISEEKFLVLEQGDSLKR